ncbi:hypothetical protein L6452_00679 [Arctium lappa]|uniref:Uncharacterized protein n=1 Tax=Arctium lappa TaxID=4217 RepID=A0ACB9FFE1_ARCLA|nr:hypothetical protein L6452_00679 [Arctium lappa]
MCDEPTSCLHQDIFTGWRYDDYCHIRKATKDLMKNQGPLWIEDFPAPLHAFAGHHSDPSSQLATLDSPQACSPVDPRPQKW